MADKKCLNRAEQQLEWHQTGFDGEHIAADTLKSRGFKGVEATRHTDAMDIVTSNTAWEVKTFHYSAKHKQMGVNAEQKLKKLAWCKEHKKKPKSMIVLVNQKTEVFIKDGIGKWRPSGMKKVRTTADWRKEIGHGRKRRFY